MNRDDAAEHPNGTRDERAGRRLSECVRAADRLAAALELDEESIPSRLLENVRSDPEPGVRAHSLRLLLDLDPPHEREAAIRVALADGDPHVLVVAAEAAGTDGFPVLETIAVTENGTAPAPRVRAIELLVEKFDAARAGPV